MATEVTQIRIQQNLAALAGGRFAERCPWKAQMTSICFHFPPGCVGVVDVAAGHGNKQAFPQEGFIALDDATPVFPVVENVPAGALLWAEIQNGDAINAHQITVIFTLQRVET